MVGQSNSEFLFEKVALIGVGLIGSSLARAFRSRNIVREIVVSARSQATLEPGHGTRACR